MTSKEVASLLTKWTESNEFKEWNDYMVHRTIAALEKGNFEFDNLTKKTCQDEPDFSTTDEEQEIEPEQEQVCEPTKSQATDNWLKF